MKKIRIPAEYIREMLGRAHVARYGKNTEDEAAWRRIDLHAQFSPRLREAFGAVNGRADSFTISATEAINRVVEAEKKMDEYDIPQIHRVGSELLMMSAGPSANAYKYVAIGTKAQFTRLRNGDWELTHVVRIDVHPKQRGVNDLYMTEAAHQKIAETAMKGFRLKMREAA